MPVLPVPSVATTADDLLLAAQRLLDRSSRQLTNDPELAVSCRAGCSSCCSQAVPATDAEVRAVIAAIDRLPVDRQAAIERRIAATGQRLAEAGVAPDIFDGSDPHAQRAASLAYLALDEPCPLLHDDLCSIHPDRPLACREYLVVSDPVHCGPPGATIDRVVRVRPRTDAVQGYRAVSAEFGEPTRRVLALALADARREGPPTAPPAEARSGPVMARRLSPPTT